MYSSQGLKTKINQIKAGVTIGESATTSLSAGGLA